MYKDLEGMEIGYGALEVKILRVHVEETLVLEKKQEKVEVTK